MQEIKKDISYLYVTKEKRIYTIIKNRRKFQNIRFKEIENVVIY